MNYILIGLPGSGKSTVGVMLAKYIGYGFLDADLAIQAQEKRLLSEIIEEEGTDGFLAVENRVLSEIVVDRCVIATGGSAVYSEEGMNHLGENGRFIYLRMSYEEMNRRLRNTFRRRGVVLKNGNSARDMYLERVPLYEKYADIVIDEQNLSAEQTLAKLLEKIK